MHSAYHIYNQNIMHFAYHKLSLRIQAIAKQKWQEKTNMGRKELTDFKKLNSDVDKWYILHQRKKVPNKICLRAKPREQIIRINKLSGFKCSSATSLIYFSHYKKWRKFKKRRRALSDEENEKHHFSRWVHSFSWNFSSLIPRNEWNVSLQKDLYSI